MGRAGLGKSRLAREALAEAERDRALTGWVQATRSAAAVPLGAFAAVISAEVRSDDPFELMQLSVRALRERADGRPLVLGVDDAPWLDPTSATLVLHLATTGTAFVVATVRSDEPCPDAIVSLWKDAGAQRFELGLLSGQETGMLMEGIVGGPVERGARQWVSETSRGNARYVRELVLGALRSGALRLVSGLWRLQVRPSVSASLTELVAARMAGLTREEQEALGLLALGEPLHLSEMLALTGSEPLASTEARGLVSVNGASADAGVWLSHPLYGEVIRAALPSLRARELRLALVETVQARASPEPEDTLRLARWLTDAGERVSTDLTIRAARAANLAGDPVFGVALASQALEAGAGIEAALLLARAHTVQSRFEEAEAVLAAAEGSIQTQPEALEYLERQSEVLHWGLGRPSELRDLLDRAASWWPDSAWKQRLAPLRLRVVSFERLGIGVAPSMQILSSGDIDADTRRRVEPVHVANLFYSGRTREAHELARQIRPALPMRGLSDAIALSRWSRITLEDGEAWSELEMWMTSALETGVALSDHATAGQAAYSLACLRFLAGRYIDAGALLAEAEVQLEHHDPLGLLAVVNAQPDRLASNRPSTIVAASPEVNARRKDRAAAESSYMTRSTVGPDETAKWEQDNDQTEKPDSGWAARPRWPDCARWRDDRRARPDVDRHRPDRCWAVGASRHPRRRDDRARLHARLEFRYGRASWLPSRRRARRPRCCTSAAACRCSSAANSLDPRARSGAA